MQYIQTNNPLAKFESTRLIDAQLLAADVDGTVMDTYLGEQSIDGAVLGYNEVLAASIEAVLGIKTAARWVERPDDTPINISATSSEILQYLAPDAKGNELELLNQRFVDAQIDLLIPQIGRRLSDGKTWPRWVDGFRPAWDQISEARRGGEPIDTAFLTHSYKRFVNAVIQKTGIDRPDIVVANELIAATQLFHYSTAEVGKGSGLPLNMLVSQWLLAHDVDAFDTDLRPARSQVIVVGDSNFDSQEAKRLGAQFVQIGSDPETGWLNVTRALNIGDTAIRHTT